MRNYLLQEQQYPHAAVALLDCPQGGLKDPLQLHLSSGKKKMKLFKGVIPLPRGKRCLKDIQGQVRIMTQNLDRSQHFDARLSDIMQLAIASHLCHK